MQQCYISLAGRHINTLGRREREMCELDIHVVQRRKRLATETAEERERHACPGAVLELYTCIASYTMYFSFLVYRFSFVFLVHGKNQKVCEYVLCIQDKQEPPSEVEHKMGEQGATQLTLVHSGGLSTTYDTSERRQQARATLRAESSWSLPNFRMLPRLLIHLLVHVLCIHGYYVLVRECNALLASGSNPTCHVGYVKKRHT